MSIRSFEVFIFHLGKASCCGLMRDQVVAIRAEQHCVLLLRSHSFQRAIYLEREASRQVAFGGNAVWFASANR